MAHLTAKQYNLRKLVVRCQGAERPLKKGAGIQKEGGNFKYENGGSIGLIQYYRNGGDFV